MEKVSNQGKTSTASKRRTEKEITNTLTALRSPRTHKKKKDWGPWGTRENNSAKHRSIEPSESKNRTKSVAPPKKSTKPKIKKFVINKTKKRKPEKRNYPSTYCEKPRVNSALKPSMAEAVLNRMNCATKQIIEVTRRK